MFGKFKQLFKNIEALDELKICINIYEDKDIQKIILTYNRIDQLTHGLDSEGNLIGVYSPSTDINSEGQTFSFEGQTFEKIAYEPYNFVDTGYFFRSFEVVIVGDGFYIAADDQKPDDVELTDKYGKQILGLTDENKTNLAKEMLPIFRQLVREKMFEKIS